MTSSVDQSHTIAELKKLLAEKEDEICSLRAALRKKTA